MGRGGLVCGRAPRPRWAPAPRAWAAARGPGEGGERAGREGRLAQPGSSWLEAVALSLRGSGTLEITPLQTHRARGGGRTEKVSVLGRLAPPARPTSMQRRAWLRPSSFQCSPSEVRRGTTSCGPPAAALSTSTFTATSRLQTQLQLLTSHSPTTQPRALHRQRTAVRSRGRPAHCEDGHGRPPLGHQLRHARGVGVAHDERGAHLGE
jgi:hypothetical protein